MSSQEEEVLVPGESSEDGPPPSLTTPQWESRRSLLPQYQAPNTPNHVRWDKNKILCQRILAAIQVEIQRLGNREGERPRGKRNREKYDLLTTLYNFFTQQHKYSIERGEITPLQIFELHPLGEENELVERTPSGTFQNQPAEETKSLRYALKYSRRQWHDVTPKSEHLLRHFDPKTMVEAAKIYLKEVIDRLEWKARGKNPQVNRHAQKRQELIDILNGLRNENQAKNIHCLEDLMKFRAPNAKHNLVQVLQEQRYGKDKPGRKQAKAYRKFDELFEISKDPDLSEAVKEAQETPTYGY